MLEIRGIWLCHMSRWDRYVLRPRIWMVTSRSGTVPHIGPYKSIDLCLHSGEGGVRAIHFHLECLLISINTVSGFSDHPHQMITKTFIGLPCNRSILSLFLHHIKTTLRHD